MDVSVNLSKIAREIEKCRKCKSGKSGKAVVGEGNPCAKIVFVGEAPGKKEAEAGRPFIGRSGQLLRQFIKKIGLKEQDVWGKSVPVIILTNVNPNSSTVINSVLQNEPAYYLVKSDVKLESIVGKIKEVLKLE